jgi:endonuclease/exonuclease/phosphatase family metal-dependent hydrolase
MKNLLLMAAVVLGAGCGQGQPRAGSAAGGNPVPAIGAGVPAPGGGESFLFCTWNVDKRNAVDRFYDEGFADEAELRKLKFDRIASALLKMNDGRGPDIIACQEVESVRAAEMLTGVLNAKVKDPALRYKSFAMKNLDAGRHIAPCVISRLQQSQVFTKLHGRDLRILETRVYANGHELVIFATHWTSQLKQNDGGTGEGGRYNYARTLRQATAPIFKKNNNADVLICGDFNCTPDSKEVLDGLGARGDKAKVKPEDDPLLFDLLAGKPNAQFGTLWYNNAPLIYDHIVVSPGMLDGAGWRVEDETVRTVTDGLVRFGATRRQPWRFGDPSANMKPEERGYADHFPVVVRLTAAPPTPPPPPPAKDKKN